jgi:hypothetical protein
MLLGMNPAIKQLSSTTKYRTGLKIAEAKDNKNINKKIANAAEFGTPEDVQDVLRYAQEENLKINENSIDRFRYEMRGGYYDVQVNERAPKSSAEEEDFRKALAEFLKKQKRGSKK